MQAPWVVKAVIALGAAAGVAGTAAAVTSGAGAGKPTALSRPSRPTVLLRSSGPGPARQAAADRAAIAYVTIHHPGSATARVLAAEPDTEHGRAVYDVRVLAPDGATYVVHVARPSGAVLSASMSESQATTQPGAAQGKPSADPEQEKSSGRTQDAHSPGSQASASQG